MRRIGLTLLYALISCVIIAGGIFGFALYRYPYTVRYMMAKVIPSVRVSYSAQDLNYLDTFNDLQPRLTSSH